MVMRDIPEDRRLSGFPRVATPSIHAEVLEVREECGTWEEFEGRLLEKYGHDDALRLSKHEFMEWVETPGKGRTASALLQDFEEQFARLSTLDRTVLGHEPCPAIRQVGGREGPGEDRPLTGDRRRANGRLSRGEESLQPF
jgi:hypothetical protein